VERAGHELRRAEQSEGRSRACLVETDEFGDDVREAWLENVAEDEESDEELDEGSDEASDEESDEEFEPNEFVRYAIAQLLDGETILE
jgi:hypothetical protein